MHRFSQDHSMKANQHWAAVGVYLAVLAGASGVFAQRSPTTGEVEFFEKNIRPVLVTECYSCHSADAKEIEAGFTLDTRDGIRKGGDRGPAVVPGSPRRSLLIAALRHTDDLEMPPEKKLSDNVIANFERWISMGAPDPRDGVAKAVARPEIDIEAGREFWSFQPPTKAAPPAVKDAAWPKSEIDRYLLAQLEAKGLKPAADADPRSLLRRVYFDLIGLPPTPETVDAFVKDHAADPQTALAGVIDTLLDSPRFGERWGRHWLDVARFAESTGQSSNVAFPHAWRYRDWVIDSLCADKPYDQFIREQIAGDLLKSRDDDERAEFLTATGFLAIGPKSLNERNPRQFRMDLADEQLDATFQVFQALTVACARCHDHKFDPIPQTDYYAVAGIFLSTESCYGTIRQIQSNHPSDLVPLPRSADVTMPLGKLTDARRKSIEDQIQAQRDSMAELTSRDNFIRRIFISSRIAQLESELDLYDAEGTPRPLAMGVAEALLTSDSPVYVRGEIDQPGPRVRRGFPQVLTAEQPQIRPGTSGRRELAEWIASAENPLTARVMANRVWLHLFGRGIVSTPDNFGASGLPPSHPELLDYLALSLIDNGWSVKGLIRQIMLSRAYQLSTEFDERNFEADPDNVLVWRMPVQRLEAEAIRDTMLKLSGRLDFNRPQGSLVATGGEGNIGFRLRGDPSMFDAHRTVYLPIVRDQLPEVLSLFDFPDPSLIIGQRSTTTIPAQSLFMLNNQFVIRQAEGMASGLLGMGDDVERIKQAYRLCFSREPTDTEINNALAFVEDYGRTHAGRTTWSAFCQAMFASAEFSQR
jgi:cytochrome c553